MAEKELKSRLVQKHDIQANWEKAVSFIPKQGEIIVYDKDESFDYVRVKIGDGQTPVNDLAFAVAPADWNAAEGEPGHVLNKTHGTEILRTEGVFDGDYSKFEYINVDGESYFAKVSDNVLTVEDLIGATAAIVENGVENAVVLTETNVSDGSSEGVPAISACSGLILIAYDTVTEAGITIDPGVYFACSGDQSTYVKSLSCLPYFERKTVKILDYEYLPESLRFGDGLITETVFSYTCTQENKSTDVNTGGWQGIEIYKLTPGETYTVVIDGVEYPCVAQYISEGLVNPAIAMGNSNLAGDDSSEPFALIFFTAVTDGIGWMIQLRDESSVTSTTVEVRGSGVKTIDLKYLPEQLQFGEEKGEILHLNLTEDTIVPDNGWEIADVYDIVLGETYEVIWNGVTYSCVAQDISEMTNGLPAVALGDIDFMIGNTSEPKMPFMLMFITDAALAAEIGVGAAVMPLDGSTNVEIIVNGVIVKTIDPKYLPKHLQFGEKETTYTFTEKDFAAGLETLGEFAVVGATSLSLPKSADGIKYRLTMVQPDGSGGAFTDEDAPVIYAASIEGDTYTVVPFFTLVNNIDANSFGYSFRIIDGNIGMLKNNYDNGATFTLTITGVRITKIPEKYLDVSIPTKTSDLTNDSGFLTAIPAGYATETYVNNKVSEINVPTKTSELTNDSGFITAADISEIPTKTSELTNDSGFITAVDIPSKTSDLTNDSGFITAADIPSSLPEPSTDGAFLRVVNGVWAAVVLPNAEEGEF